MAIPYCPGYDHEPFATLVATYPGKDVHPAKDKSFRNNLAHQLLTLHCARF